MPRLKTVKVNLGLPHIGSIEGSWEPDETEQRAAWEIYVELVTRISVADPGDEHGSLREALTSLYSLFGTVRDILRKYGPAVGRPDKHTDLSVGYLSIAVLNTVLRPLLSKWHPLLQAHETLRPVSASPIEHEDTWGMAPALRSDLASSRLVLISFADLLADVAQVPSLVKHRRSLH